MPNILLVGNGAREHAMAEAILRSNQKPRLFSFMKANNPGIASLSEKIKLGGYSDLEAITGPSALTKVWHGWKHPNHLPAIWSKNIIFPAIRSLKYLQELMAWKLF
jgi:hypothetical protein